MNGQSSEGRPKRQVRNRKTINMEQKMTIINRFEGGQRLNSISKEFGLASSTVKTILKDRDRIKGHVSTIHSLQSTIITKKRAGALSETEKLLTSWIGQQKAPLGLAAIQAKARSLFQELKEKLGDSDAKFVASNGWFHRFKARAGLSDIKLSGDQEPVGDADSYPSVFRDIVERGGYGAHHVYSVGQTEMFWRVTSGKNRSSRGSHDKMTVLLGCNASGNHKLKPLLLLHPEQTKAAEADDSCHCRFRPDVLMTADLFEDWFLNCFVPDVEEYCTQRGVPAKSLLVLNDGLRHLTSLNDYRPNVKVVFLPPHAAHVLEPAHLGLVTAFRRLYLRQVLEETVAKGAGKFRDVAGLFASVRISDAIRNARKVCEVLDGTCTNGAWAKLCPPFVRGGRGCDEYCRSITEDILKLSAKLGFEWTSADVDGFFGASHYELLKSRLPDEVAECYETFDSREMATAFGEIATAIARFQKMDPDYKRFLKVKNAVERSLSCYRQILEREKTALDPFSSSCEISVAVTPDRDTLVVPVHPDDVMLISSSSPSSD